MAPAPAVECKHTAQEVKLARQIAVAALQRHLTCKVRGGPIAGGPGSRRLRLDLVVRVEMADCYARFVVGI